MALRLMDTNIASFMLKGHSLATRYRRHLQGHQLAVSFMTVAELYEWGLLCPLGQNAVRSPRIPAERSGHHSLIQRPGAPLGRGPLRAPQAADRCGRRLDRGQRLDAWLRTRHAQCPRLPRYSRPHDHYRSIVAIDTVPTTAHYAAVNSGDASRSDRSRASF
jgi:hypothetical protein